MGYLYQLKLGTHVGQTVKIDGPFDTWGYVVALKESGFNLIRGTGNVKAHRTRVQRKTRTRQQRWTEPNEHSKRVSRRSMIKPTLLELIDAQ